MYKTIIAFVDLEDDMHPYDIGDKFPRKGLTVTEERLSELSSDKNKRGIPVIELVADKVPAKKKRATKTKGTS